MLTDITVNDFINKVASNEPIPGGGSISAFNAALAASLAEMVANLTIGKKKYIDVEEEMKQLVERAKKLREVFAKDIDRDADAYTKVFAAFKLPKESEEEKEIRSNAIQKATMYAAQIPMEVALLADEMLDLIVTIAHKGNSNAVTDACVAMMCARTAILGALLNVRINLSAIKDRNFVTKYSEEALRLEKRACDKEQELLTYAKETYEL